MPVGRRRISPLIGVPFEGLFGREAALLPFGDKIKQPGLAHSSASQGERQDGVMVHRVFTSFLFASLFLFVFF